MHFRRRNSPLFPSTPQRSPVSASPISSASRPISPFDAFPSTPRFQPRISNFSPGFPAENTAATPNSVSRNVLRWDRDGCLHPIEHFIAQYGGSKSSPPPQWTNSDENMRTDISDGKDYNIFSFVDEYGGSLANPPPQWLDAPSAPRHVVNSIPEDIIFPYGRNFKPPASLFRMAAPALKYPTGSIDENVNAHFVRSALGYLRSSTFVRDIIDWDPRPHPFYHFEQLKRFANAHGYPDYVFDPSKTLPTLQWVESISPSFGHSLRMLYNSGGIIISYSNINERIPHRLFVA